MNRHSFRLAVVFSLMVFLVILFTTMVLVTSAMLLFRFGLLGEHNGGMILVAFAVISVIIGTLLARFGGRKLIAPIIEISEATKEVAKGNYNIELKTTSRAHEVNTMAENFMLMAQELSHTEAMHNDFINNVSHEFKTPLTAIEGYATLLQNRSLSEEKREAYVSKIMYNARRLSSLTGNILLLSRLEHQEITAGKTWFSLDEQLRENILMLEDKWEAKELVLDISLDPLEYYGNGDLLSQVWQNLIGNAVKFVPDGGHIGVSLKHKGESAVVCISDSGIGMSGEVAKLIFEKFYQGDASHSSEGNGLGLTLAKRIVDLHGGSIEVNSEEGMGSVFTVTLPLGK